MGHIVEECGLEQGGVNLSDFFKIFGTEEPTSAHDSSLGVYLRSLKIGLIGKADITALLSNCLYKLNCLFLRLMAFMRKPSFKFSTQTTSTN